MSGQLESEWEFVLVNTDLFSSERKQRVFLFVDQETAVGIKVELQVFWL